MGGNYILASHTLKGVILLYPDILNKRKQSTDEDTRVTRQRPIEWLVATLLQHSTEDSFNVTNYGDMFVLVSRDPAVTTLELELNVSDGSECYCGDGIKIEPTTGLTTVDAALMVAVANAGLCEGTLFSLPGTWQVLASEIPIESIQLSRSELGSFMDKKQKVEHTPWKTSAKGGEVVDPERDWEDTSILIRFREEDFINNLDPLNEFVIDAPVLIDAAFQDVSFKLANREIVRCNRTALATSSEFFKKCLFGGFKHSEELEFETFDATSCRILLQIILSKRESHEISEYT